MTKLIVISLLHISLVSIIIGSCTVRNKFTIPYKIEDNKDIKRLILFTGNEVNRNNPSINPGAGNTLIAVPYNKKRKLNLTQPRRSYAAYVFEMSATDTGTVSFVMGLEQPLGRKNFYAEQILNIRDFETGNNYLHINTFMQRMENSKWIPVIEIKPVDTNRDIFLAPRPMKFKHVLTYNLSKDAIIFESKKAIATKKERNDRIYKNILKRNLQIDTTIVKSSI
jgi:hypothetical protein